MKDEVTDYFRDEAKELRIRERGEYWDNYDRSGL